MTRIVQTPRGAEAEIDRQGISASWPRILLSLLLRFVGDCFAGERTRWALWIPVFMGVGIALYFSLPYEPEIWFGPVLIGFSLLATLGFRQQQGMLLALVAILFVALGFGVAQMRTVLVEAPVLQKKIGPVGLEGRIHRLEVLTKGNRLWLDRLSVDRLGDDQTPDRVRIKYFSKQVNLKPGDRIQLRAILHPPSGPAMPGAFDFARRAYFQRLGGVGYAIGRPMIISPSKEGGFSIWLAALRHRITETIHQTVPGTAGAIAAALITGERGAIPEDVLAAMRESGLAHLLAISGLHIGLVGGLLFFAIRLVLAFFERIGLRYPIKKWAAVAALIGSFAYLLISGATLPTQRAFLMLSFVMLAVIIDRSAISMNLVAWAAGCILLMAPESLVSVSFQMSFAAVTALIATYEQSYTRQLGHANGRSRIRKTVFYLLAVLLTTLVAGVATAPFALYHFNQVALYGVAANLFAVPLTALWIMPWAIVAFILMPFGLAELALLPMGWGIEGVVTIAKTVQDLPGAVLPLPAMPEWGLALISVGGLWLCLWRLPWRAVGLCPIVIGILTISIAKTPDILVSDTGKLFAVKGNDGQLGFFSRANGFVAETWLRRNGQSLSNGASQFRAAQCDSLGCVVRTRGKIVKHMAALREDCGVATIVISQVPVRDKHCRSPEVVVDRFDVWRDGAHALWLSPDGIRQQTVADTNSGRPWSRYPRNQQQRR
jgi:competence protein ComEC